MDAKQSATAIPASKAGTGRVFFSLAALAVAAMHGTAVAQTSGRLTVANHCSFPIWLQFENNSDTPGVPVLPKTPPNGPATILPLAAGEGPLTVAIPDVGWAGRFFPKLGCNPQTGNDCQGGQALAPCPGGCQPPTTTKIEFNYANLTTSRDSWYDISLVDGYNLAARITPRGAPQGGSCSTTTCSLSLAACPSDEIDGLGSLVYPQAGTPRWCYSPCKKWNYPTYGGMGRPETVEPGKSFCCPNPPVSSEECNAGPVVQTQYVTTIRRDCPSAYSFAFDDKGGNHNCPTATAFDVVLCP